MTVFLLAQACDLLHNFTRVSKGKNRDAFRVAFIVLLVGGLGALCLHFCSGSSAAPNSNIYAANAPLSHTPDTVLPFLIPLTAEQIARIPMADGFQWPVGAPHLAFMYDAQGFGVHNGTRGGYHSGQDLNGIGGQNTDAGEAVRAAARGTVVYCGTPSAGWGKCVILAHRLPGDPTIYQTLYAHLQDVNVAYGDTLCRGQQLGTIGTAEGVYLAHLHFEVIASRVVEAGITAYHPAGTMNRLNPTQFINEHAAPAFPDPMWDVYAQLKLNESYNSGAY